MHCVRVWSPVLLDTVFEDADYVTLEYERSASVTLRFSKRVNIFP